MSNYSTSEGVIPFANNRKSNGADQLDAAGQSIVQLLHKAAGFAEANSRHALDMAQKLSHQLCAAEERIARFEAAARLPPTKRARRAMAASSVYSRMRIDFSSEQMAVGPIRYNKPSVPGADTPRTPRHPVQAVFGAPVCPNSQT